MAMSLGELFVDIGADVSDFQSSMKSVQKSIQKAGKKMQSVGKNLTAGVSAPLAALGGTALAAADDINKAMQTIQTGTGATGEKLQGLGEDFRKVFADIPTSSKTAAEAIATLNTLTGETGETLQELTKNVLEASRVLGEDGAANADLFGKALNQWQIPAEEGADVLDKLFKVTQNYGVGLGQVTNQLNEYGSVLQNAGFSMVESADFFGRLNKAGLSVSRIMPGLNMSFRKWAEEGKDTRKELQRVIDQIRNTEDSTKALAIATEVFGAEGAQRVTTAIRSGTIPALNELGAGLQNTSGLVEETAERNKSFADIMRELRNQVQLALEPLGQALLQVFESLRPQIDALIGFIQRLSQWFANLSPTAQNVVLALGGIAAGIGPLLVVIGTLITSMSAIVPVVAAVTAPMWGWIAAIAAVGVAIGVLWAKNEDFRKGVIKIWDTIKKAAMDVFGQIQENVQYVTEQIMIFWEKWGDAILAYLKGIWDQIKLTVETAINLVKDIFAIQLAIMRGDWEEVWTRIQSIGQTVWNYISGTLKNVTNTWMNVWANMKDNVLGIWEGMSGGIKGIINGIIEAVNGMINRLNTVEFSIPDWVPRIGGRSWGFDIPNIPKLATGGRILSSGLAIVGEEGPELVNLPTGAEVMSNTDSQNMMGGSPINIEQMVVRDESDIQKIARELHRLQTSRSRGLGVT